MAKKGGFNVDIKIDKRLANWLEREAPERLQTARKKAVEAAGMVWADEAKDLTRSENHVDTGLYVNSIGYSTGSPSKPLNELKEEPNKTILKTGAAVSYAAALEKRYALMARGLDRSRSRIEKVAATQVKNTLRL